MPRLVLFKRLTFQPVSTPNVRFNYSDSFAIPFSTTPLTWNMRQLYQNGTVTELTYTPEALQNATLRSLTGRPGVEISTSLSLYPSGRTTIGIGQDLGGALLPRMEVTLGGQVGSVSRMFYSTRNNPNATPTRAVISDDGVLFSSPCTPIPGVEGGDFETGIAYSPPIEHDANLSIALYQPGTLELNRWEQVSLCVVLDVVVTVDCSGQGLIDTEVCLDYCQREPEDCVTSYNDFCFPDRIGTVSECRNFVANRIQTVGPDAVTDSQLRAYCTSRYSGFEALFESGVDTDIELCACQMDPELYETFRRQLEAKFPGFNDPLFSAGCLVPRCASSAFKSVETGKTCSVPECISFVSLRNDGSFDDSSLIVNADAPGCTELVGGDEPEPPPPPPPAKREESPWSFIVLMAAVAVLLLALILVVAI